MLSAPLASLLALFLAAIPVGAIVGLRSRRHWQRILYASFVCAVVAVGVVVLLMQPALDFSSQPGLGIWVSIVFWVNAWFAAVGIGVALARWASGAGETRQLVAVVIGVLLVPAVLAATATGTLTIVCSRAFADQGCW